MGAEESKELAVDETPLEPHGHGHSHSHGDPKPKPKPKVTSNQMSKRSVEETQREINLQADQVIYLGLISGAGHKNDPEIAQYRIPEIFRRLDEFREKINPKIDADPSVGDQSKETERKTLDEYTLKIRDSKEKTAEELKNDFPAQHFNDTCKEGYDLLTNVLKYSMLPRDGETE